jgi:ketosteroid isomerase-like protein
MSQENAEIVRAALDAFNRGDREAALKDMAPDFELDMSRAISPDQRGIYGLDQMRQFWDAFVEPFESFRFEAEEFIEAGDRVILPTTAHARGRDGIEVTARAATVYTIRDGAIVRMCMYQTLQEALEAARPSEPGPDPAH